MRMVIKFFIAGTHAPLPIPHLCTYSNTLNKQIKKTHKYLHIKEHKRYYVCSNALCPFKIGLLIQQQTFQDPVDIEAPEVPGTSRGLECVHNLQKGTLNNVQD